MPPSPSTFHPPGPFALNPVLAICLSPFRGGTNLRHCWLPAALLERPAAPSPSPAAPALLLLPLSLSLRYFFPPFSYPTLPPCIFVNKNRGARQAVWLSRENGNPILVLRPLKGARAGARLPIRNARKFYGSALRAAICQMKNRPSTAQWSPVEKLDRSCPPGTSRLLHTNRSSSTEGYL